MRLFQVRAKPGCAETLLRNFETTSADVVRNEAGNKGYFFGGGIPDHDGFVVFASIWRDLDAVKDRFGEDWQSSFLPPGYEDLIDECSVRHIDLSAGWHVNLNE
ncbi:MAG: hypothetical protein QNJ16_17945 [Rhodobacter sp.]|nr:hypothetical protein [Rhodobacter sp.]